MFVKFAVKVLIMLCIWWSTDKNNILSNAQNREIRDSKCHVHNARFVVTIVLRSSPYTFIWKTSTITKITIIIEIKENSLFIAINVDAEVSFKPQNYSIPIYIETIKTSILKDASRLFHIIKLILPIMVRLNKIELNSKATLINKTIWIMTIVYMIHKAKSSRF